MVRDTDPNVIANGMQLIGGGTGQEYNQRKGRQGALWEDRYHAAAMEADQHLDRCLSVVDAVEKFNVPDPPTLSNSSSDLARPAIERSRIHRSGTEL